MPSTRRAAGNSSASWRSPPTRCGCRPGKRKIAQLSGGEKRRVALCRLLLSAARHAAAGRADQPSGCGIGGMARALPRGISEHRGGRHARPLLPRQRCQMDPGARSRPRHSVAGQLLLVARAEGEAPGARGAGARGVAQEPGARTRMGAHQPEGTAGQEQGAPGALRGTGVKGVPGAQRDQRNLHSARASARRTGHRGGRPVTRATATDC